MVNRLNLPEETKNVFSVWMISQHLRKYYSVCMYMFLGNSVCVTLILHTHTCIYNVFMFSLVLSLYYFCTSFIYPFPLSNSLLFLFSDLQLKSYHVPVKLFKKWNEFLTQYTTASYEVCSTGIHIQCIYFYTCTCTHACCYSVHVHVIKYCPYTQYMYLHGRSIAFNGNTCILIRC